MSNIELFNMKENPIIWISKFWLEFESLLAEAVQRNCLPAVKILLEYEEKIQVYQDDSNLGKIREKDSNALLLAARNGNYQLMKLFRDKNYTISPVHLVDCNCSDCRDNKLGQSKRRMETLQALSNPIWIKLTSEDPFLTAFKLCELSRKFKLQDDCFERNYQEIADSNQQFCLNLLDEVESEEEGCCIMAHKKLCDYVNHDNVDHEHDNQQCDDVTFVQLAIEFGQKDVVAHPTAQHFITSIVFDKIPKWRTSSLIYKIFFIITVAFFYPITTISHIFFPCTPAGRIGNMPLVKFVNVAASFITFLALLAWMGATNRHCGIMNGSTPSQIEILTFIWLVGLCIGEVQQLIDKGIRDYFSSGWNFIDINMMLLMVTSFITWTALFISDIDKTDELYKQIYDFVDGIFAIAIILSFFRLVYLMQITRYLGLLQLCLGEMIQVIFQFAFISVVVLCSFSVAMAFLCHSSEYYHKQLSEKRSRCPNKTYIYWLLNVSYDGLPATMITLIWASLNMIGIKSLKGLDDGTLIHLWSHLLFGLYFCVSMIVLLNMLIAMMSNSYQRIENNLEVEHKFSRTVLWVDYIGDENSRPVPFNLLPSMKTLKQLFSKTGNVLKRRNSRMHRDKKPELNKKAHDKYKALCNTLIERYFIRQYGFNYLSDELEEQTPENKIFIQKVTRKCIMWAKKTSPNEGSCQIDTVSTEGAQISRAVEGAVEGQLDSLEKNSLYTPGYKEEFADLWWI